MTHDQKTLDVVVQGYLVCMLWTMPGDEGNENPGDSIPIYDLPKQTWGIARADCAAFLEACGDLFTLAIDAPGYSAERFGHDFALTRNGHGAGFWDRDELKEDDLGDTISALCGWAGGKRTPFTENNLYLGDDGLAYFERGAI